MSRMLSGGNRGRMTVQHEDDPMTRLDRAT
jgi:hypothetical protein